MELEQMDKALKASWQTVAQNMNIVRLLLITRQPSENAQTLLSRSEAMMKELMQVKGLTTDTYALGYLRPGNDMTVCRVEVKPEAMPEAHRFKRGIALPHRPSADDRSRITKSHHLFGGAKWRRFVCDAKKIRPSSSSLAWKTGR